MASHLIIRDDEMLIRLNEGVKRLEIYCFFIERLNSAARPKGGSAVVNCYTFLIYFLYSSVGSPVTE